MAKTPEERMEDLVEAMNKLTDTDERLVKVQEKRLSDLKKTERKLESFENLGKQLRESLLAPLQGIARMIPAPLKILGKMAIAPIVKPMLQASMAGQTAAAGAVTPGAGPEGGGLFKGAMAEAMGREMSQKGIYRGAIATMGAVVPGLSKLDRFSMAGGEPGAGDGGGLLGALTPGEEWLNKIVAGFQSINTTLIENATFDDEKWQNLSETLELIAEASLELFHLQDISDFVGELATAGGKEGSIQVHDASVEEKLEEIDENTEPKKVSKAKIREDELEARKKKPGVATIKKLGPAALDWKKLLIGLAMVGGAFGIAKAISFWQDVIIPAGGFQKWWKDSGWPTMKEWALKLGNNVINAIGGVFGIEEGEFQKWWDETAAPEVTKFVKTLIPAIATSLTAGLIQYIDENKEQWGKDVNKALGGIPRKIFDTVLGISVGGIAGAKIGGIVGTFFGGPGLGTLAGALIGAVLGMVIGGVGMYFKGEEIINVTKAVAGVVGGIFSAKMTTEKWGALLGGLGTIAILAAIPTGGMSLVAMLAIILAGAAIGAVVTGLGEKLPGMRDEAESSMSILERDARLATRSWREKHITDPLSGWIDAVKGFAADVFNIETWQEEGKIKEAKEYLEALKLRQRYEMDEYTWQGYADEIDDLKEQIRLAEHPSDRARVTMLEQESTAAAVETALANLAGGDSVGSMGSLEGAAREMRRLFEGTLGQSMMTGTYNVDLATQQGEIRDKIRMLENRIEKSKGWFSNVYEGSDKEGRARDQQELDTLKGVLKEFTSVIHHSEPHLVTDIGEMYKDIGLKGFLKALIGRGTFDVWGNIGGSTLELAPTTEMNRKIIIQTNRANEIIGMSLGPINSGNPLMGGGGVDFNSMANVNTTNISQAKTRDVGMALAFTKTKNSRLGYAVS